ncbi:uncharacterized protein LOC107783644 isoform X3 [Nicotiana tabacum]|uniref:Uncharacterized protein LOC107783644 isoform X3 n=3 Tax=Nicotiana tabacum TaxID=4097 RepID=A0AC58RN59_TOBAC
MLFPLFGTTFLWQEILKLLPTSPKMNLRLLELQMSTVKKHLPSACCAQKRKQQCSTEIVSKINRRRRDLYKQLSVDKKELLLTRRRSKKLELKKGSTALLEYTKQAAGFELHTEKNLTIVEAPCIAGKGISSAVGAVVDCHKGKNIADHFSIFEHGSTSGAPCDRHHVETSTDINKGILKRSSKVKCFHKLVLKETK